MKIAILGYGLEGVAALNYFNKPENTISICDQNLNLDKIDGIDYQLGVNYLKNLDRFDLIIRSPGINPLLIYGNNPEIDQSKITSGTNIFFEQSLTKNIIGISGTKGKGTTSSLIHNMLLEVGKKSFLAGNIGIPAISLLSNHLDSNDYVVLELSSFQLSDCNYSPHIAVCLMITQDHLDWHGRIEDYLESKRNMVSHQRENDVVVYLASNQRSKALAESSLAEKIPYLEKPGAIIFNDNIVIDDQIICPVREVGLLGEHNLENICAAVTCVWQISKNRLAIAKVIKSFTGLKNRIEFIEEKNGIKYYNDSFASAPDAAIAGMKAVKTAKVLIIGGYDRNLDLKTLVESIIYEDNKGLIRKLILIGASAKRLAEELRQQKYTDYLLLDTKNMTEIVESATGFAQSGDAVVLSPGFASFDMFKNFEERGQAFVEAVNNL
jgi:UDP-N-acetylmuramoylalanine--D-glutamate ligase